MRDRYARTGDLADLEAALTAHQQAIQATPPDSPDRPARLNNLGNGLRDRYARTGDLADLEAAITAPQQAIQATPPDSPARPGYLNNLGIGLRDRYIRTGDLADLEAGVSAFEKACQSGLDWPSSWRSWRHATGAPGRSKDVPGLRPCAPTPTAWGPATSSSRCSSCVPAKRPGYARRGASTLTRRMPWRKRGDLRGAVATLERGRARLLSQVLERDRADLEHLQALAADVYSQYAAATNRLQVLEAQDISGQTLFLPARPSPMPSERPAPS